MANAVVYLLTAGKMRFFSKITISKIVSSVSLFIFQAELFLKTAIKALSTNCQQTFRLQANITACSLLQVHLYSSAHRVQTALMLCQFLNQ